MRRRFRPAGAAAALGLLFAAACAPAEKGPTLADRAAIEATLERYTRGLDELDADLYVSAMAPDGQVVVYDDVFEGPDTLRKLIADEAELRRTDPRTLFHVETNSTIEFLAPDRAEHRAYWFTYSRTGDGPDDLSIIGLGRQVDDLRKIDGEWLIARRTIMDDP